MSGDVTNKAKGEDDDAEFPQGVARLFEMDTREVSLVDRAANKSKYLLVKNEDGVPSAAIEVVTGSGATNVTTASSAKISFDLSKGETKTEAGQSFPASAYAYVPDPARASTWKLRLFDRPGDENPSVRLTAYAAAAISKNGWRGQHAEIPAADLAVVKSEVKKAWFKARRAAGQQVTEEDLPAILKRVVKAAVSDGLSELEVLLGMDAWQVSKAETLAAFVADRCGTATPAPVAKQDAAAIPAELRPQLVDAVSKSLAELHELHAGLSFAGSPLADQFQVGSRLIAAADLIKSALAGLGSAPEGNVSTTAQTSTAPTPAAPPAEVAKVGRPMNGDRLNRLKSAVRMLKDALGDLKSGSVSVSKFDQVAHALDSIISECSVSKFMKGAERQRAAKMAGAADMRGPTPLAPNQGAGWTPDTSSIADASAIFGEGVPPQVADILKRVTALESSNTELRGSLTKRDETIKTLHGHVKELKKFRDAPSMGDGDGELQVEAEPLADDTTWPIGDMNEELALVGE